MAFVDENLLVKTFYAESPEEIDKLCNTFRDNHIIRFTQSNTFFDSERKKIVYVYTLFYKLKDLTKSMPVKQEVKANPVAPSKSNFSSPKLILDESEAKWANCGVCQARWKWTHYKMCPNRHGIEGLPEQYHERYMEIWGLENGNKENNTENKGV